MRLTTTLLPILLLATLPCGHVLADDPPADPEDTAPDAAPDGPPATADDGPQPTTLSWSAAVAEMERKNPLMRAARAGLTAYRAKLSQAEWAQFPSFNLEGGVLAGPEMPFLGIELADPADVVAFAARVKITMVQPLWTFGKISSLKAAARRGIDVGKAQINLARWDLRYRAAQAWNGMLLAAELSQILEEGTRWLDKAKKRMERLKDEDSVEYDQMEHLRLKTRIADFFQLEAQNKVLQVTSQSGFRLLLGRGPDEVVVPDKSALEPIEYAFHPVERYLEVALANEPKLLMARSGHAAKEELANWRQAELWPDFVLAGEAALADTNVKDTGDSAIASDPDNKSSAGLVLGVRWNLDLGVRGGRAKEALADARKLGYQAEAQARLVELDVRRLYQELENARRMIDVYERSRKAAQGWLTATWDLYDTGFGNFRDVMDALVQFYSKKVAYLQVVHEHNVKVFELSRAVGTDVTKMPPAEQAGAPVLPPTGME